VHRNHISVGSIPFLTWSLERGVAEVLSMAGLRNGTHVHFANSYNVALASRDTRYSAVFETGSWNFADGRYVSLASRFLSSTSSLPQVRGPSFFPECLRVGQARGTRHFLLGSTPETLSRLKDRILQRFPDALIVGVLSPPFRPLTKCDMQDILDCIREADADIVWIGMGTPKQDFIGKEISEKTGIVTATVGAAFDFVAGTLPEAPLLIRSAGLEWLFRLLSEPRRLWRRYFFGNLRFLHTIARQWIRQGGRRR